MVGCSFHLTPGRSPCVGTIGAPEAPGAVDRPHRVAAEEGWPSTVAAVRHAGRETVCNDHPVDVGLCAHRFDQPSDDQRPTVCESALGSARFGARVKGSLRVSPMAGIEANQEVRGLRVDGPLGTRSKHSEGGVARYTFEVKKQRSRRRTGHELRRRCLLRFLDRVWGGAGTRSHVGAVVRWTSAGASRRRRRPHRLACPRRTNGRTC
jgi:hypothetical protein